MPRRSPTRGSLPPCCGDLMRFWHNGTVKVRKANGAQITVPAQDIGTGSLPSRGAAANSHGPPGVGKTLLAERVPGLLPDLDVPARRRVEFRPSHLSYALRASGHVLHPAARLAPRGPTPKSRFPCASGR